MFKGRFGYDVLNRMNMFYNNLTTLQSGYNVLNSAIDEGVNATYQYSDYYLERVIIFVWTILLWDIILEIRMRSGLHFGYMYRLLICSQLPVIKV